MTNGPRQGAQYDIWRWRDTTALGGWCYWWALQGTIPPLGAQHLGIAETPQAAELWIAADQEATAQHGVSCPRPDVQEVRVAMPFDQERAEAAVRAALEGILAQREYLEAALVALKVPSDATVNVFAEPTEWCIVRWPAWVTEVLRTRAALAHKPTGSLIVEILEAALARPAEEPAPATPAPAKKGRRGLPSGWMVQVARGTGSPRYETVGVTDGTDHWQDFLVDGALSIRLRPQEDR